jgi:diphthine-ammonia ligase
MKNYIGKKFVASYSGGKDSTLAIYRAIKQEMKPVELFTTYNTDRKQSWFHGLPRHLLDNISVETEIPIVLIETTGEEYAIKFEAYLRNAKDKGAEICVFGDIDLEEHLRWCTDRCNSVGIEPYFPLWQESRRDLVYEFIDSGFTTIITVVDTSRLDQRFLGKILTKEVAEEIEKSGADICGENGEYHTFAFDGPLFKNPVNFNADNVVHHDNYAILPIF